MIRHIFNSLKTCVEGALSRPTLNPIFGPTIPNHTHPASTVSMSTDVPANILVFRTITSMLAHLPQTTPFKPTDNLENEAWESTETRKELKISDAFAQLAVSQHDVVAVSTYRGSSLDVMTCATKDTTKTDATKDTTETDKDTDPSNAQPSGLVQKIIEIVELGWNLLITRNDRSADPSTSSGTPYPTIIPPVEPDNLKGRTAYQYMLSLEEHWIKPTLPTHLWILSGVLTEGAQRRGQNDFRADLSKHLFRYTAAMSCQKIKRRLTNPHLSRPFIESLQKVTDVPIPSRFRRISASTGNARHDLEESTNDRLLLQDFVKLTKKYDRILNSPIPNLLHLACNLPESNAPIYNDDTCMEFHQLLLELLARFETALVDLSGLDEKTEGFSDQSKKSMADTQLYGYALLRLARGQAFRMHIRNIGALLKRYHTNVGAPMPAANAEDHEVPDEELEDPDEELEAIQPANYVGWLRLVVAHFDAVEIVLSYVTSTKSGYPSSISAKILVAPSTSAALYPWRELLIHPEYFPTGDQDPASTSTTSNQQILNFLETEVSKASNAKNLSSWARTARDGWTNRTPASLKYQQICRALNNLADSDDPDVKSIAKAVDDALQIWQKPNNSQQVVNDLEVVITEGIEELYNKLYPLPAGNAFFCNLDNQSFKGAMHCEACLGSLLNNFTRHVQPGSIYDEMVILLSEMQFYGRIIGVSKRCCPVCFQFLSQLIKWAGGQPYIVRGSHSVISACTLPPWTPSEVVDKMIQIFGAILRRDLVALQKNTAEFNTFNRNRSQSTTSDTLSIDSSESWGGNISQNLVDDIEDISFHTPEVQH